MWDRAGITCITFQFQAPSAPELGLQGQMDAGAVGPSGREAGSRERGWRGALLRAHPPTSQCCWHERRQAGLLRSCSSRVCSVFVCSLSPLHRKLLLACLVRMRRGPKVSKRLARPRIKSPKPRPTSCW